MNLPAKLKVVHILGSLSRGGTETLLLDIANQKKHSPFELVVIHRKPGKLESDFHASGVKIYYIKAGRTFLYVDFLIKLRKIIKKEKISIIHSHQRMDTLLAWFATLGLTVKLIQTIHDFYIPNGIPWKYLTLCSMQLARKNLFVSKAQRDFYDSKFKVQSETKTLVVYNGVDMDKFVPGPNLDIRKEWGIKKNEMLLGMVGNFNSVRDQMTICRFLRLLDQKKIGFIFLFIGSKVNTKPQLYEECISYCQNNGIANKVVFSGSREDVPQILKQLDAFIYSSDHDTFGIAVIEAIAAGITVFVNDLKVMTEITENGKRAILYQTKNEQDLLDKFLEYYACPEKFHLLSKENSLWAKNKYGIINHVEQLHRVYNFL